MHEEPAAASPASLPGRGLKEMERRGLQGGSPSLSSHHHREDSGEGGRGRDSPSWHPAVEDTDRAPGSDGFRGRGLSIERGSR